MRIVPVIFLTLLSLLTGCATPKMIVSNTSAKVDRNEYRVNVEPAESPALHQYAAAIGTISPTESIGFGGFKVCIENKTGNEIFVKWNKTYYLYNGQANGGFMFEGVRYSDRNKVNELQDDLVLPNGKFEKIIYPNALAKLQSTLSGPYWANGFFKDGTHGLYLTLSVNNELAKEQIEVTTTKWAK